MAKYKVAFSGFAYVEADDEEEAEDKMEMREEVYCEYSFDSVEEVEEFAISF